MCRNEFDDSVFAHSNLFSITYLSQGESHVAFQTITLVVHHEFQYVIFEGDSKGIIEAPLQLHFSPWFF